MPHPARVSAIKPFAFLVFAACAIAPGAALAQEKAADKLLPVTVELGDVSLTKLPFIMAADYGIYERNGLKVRQFITPSAAAAVAKRGVNVPAENISKEMGEINIGGGSPTMVRMTSVATAPHRVILATTDIISRYHIMSRADIKKPEDLKDKRIGYGNFGALGHFSILMYLQKMGIDPEKDVSMLTNGTEIEDVLDGHVDVIAGNGISVLEAKKRGLNDLADLNPMKIAMPGSGVNALESWLEKNHETAKHFMKATVEAIAMMKNDKKAAFASMTKWYGITEMDKLEGIYAEATDLPNKPYPSIAGLKNMQSIYTWRAIADRTPESFTDASFVTELDKSGYIDSLYPQSAAKK